MSNGCSDWGSDELPKELVYLPTHKNASEVIAERL